MKKLTFLKSLLMALSLLGGGTSAWADRVYFNDFSTGNGITAPAGLTIHGDGTFVDDADANFGKVFQNGGGAQRTHYLQLPSDVLSHSATSKKMTIGFWVNAKNAGASNTYMWAPLFMAYAAAPVKNANTLPMLACQYRGVLQINNAGWCDYVDAQNVKRTNAVYHDATDWLADDNWHYYTVVFDGEIASVYFDGVLKNQWDATIDYNNGSADITDTTQDGLYTKGSALTYVCLGGNQAWGWGDNDAAFMFDDFAVYDEALSSSQILSIMTAKKGTTAITAIPSSYNFNADDATINPFDKGTIVTGTNVKGLNVNNTTATAWFDSDSSVDGNQAYALSTDETVTVQITALHGWLGSGKEQGVKLLNSEGYTLAEYVYTLGSCNITDVKIGGSRASAFTAAYNCQSFNGQKNANGFGNNPYNATAGNNPVITFTVGYDGYVTLNITKTQAGINNTYTGNLPAEWAVDLQKIQVYSGSNNSDRTIGIMNMNITTETAEKHTVTFVYEDVDGNSLSSLKPNESAQATAGTSVSSLVTSTVTASFLNGDESVRYDYADAYTVTGDATEVPNGDITVTLKFAPKSKFTYTVRAVDGSDNVLNPNVTSGYVFDGDNATITYPQYILSGTTLYNIANNGSGDWYRRQITPDADGYVYDLIYNNGTVSDVVFYAEAEDISGMTPFFNNANRASNGYIAYSNGAYKDVTTLEPGKYQVYTKSIRSNSNTHELNVKCGESVVGTFAVENGTNVWKNTEEFTVYATSTLAVASAGGSQAGLDFLYIVKTGDAAVPVTFGTTKYATFASPYALDLRTTASLKAYKAAVDGTTVRFTELDQTVPANTGVLLEGTAGETISIPVVASGDDVSENAFEVNTAGTTFTAESGYTYYGLMKNSNPLTFATFNPATVAIPANKAYLKVANGEGVHALNVLFDDTTDGIQSVDKAQQTDGNYYDLSGRRVMNPTKGIYVKAGKKVVVK